MSVEGADADAVSAWDCRDGGKEQSACALFHSERRIMGARRAKFQPRFVITPIRHGAFLSAVGDEVTSL
jgi:hypothetical protein